MEFKKITLILLTLITLGCSKDNELDSQKNQLTNLDFTKFNKFDQIEDLVLEIGENQNISGRSFNVSNNSFLPFCTSITTTYTGNTWTRIVDFGSEGCIYFNGAILKGKIIYSGTLNSNENEYIINYTFDEFYYDEIKVDGEKNYHRYSGSSDLLDEEHPIFTMDIDLTLTDPDNNIYERIGTKSKEFVEGFNTVLNVFDNKHLITGNWITMLNGDTIQNTTILDPLEKKSICPYIRSGELEIVYYNDTYNINYGNGNCDNLAQISINGGVPFTIYF